MKELAMQLKAKKMPVKDIQEATGLSKQQLVWLFYGNGRRLRLKEKSSLYFNVNEVINWLV